MKGMVAYKREKRIYLRPLSEAETFTIATDPVTVIEEGELPSRKGSAVREALAHSKKDVPDPARWDDPNDPLLKAAGVRSYSKFEKSASSCDVYLKGDQLRFTPYKNLRPRRGYVPIVDREMFLPADASDEEVGIYLEKTFDACE
ncbi:MAG: hypothetical protein V2B18_01605 [Pseudomonadota bacterium]